MTTAIYTKLCPGSAPGAGHSALTQQNMATGEVLPLYTTYHQVGSTNEGVIEHLVILSFCMWL